MLSFLKFNVNYYFIEANKIKCFEAIDVKEYFQL
jgi:hypothetical protein